MIEAITISNFKGIREPTRIELKPITLLFGANSAGKSSVIQALRYASHLLEGRSPDDDPSDPDRPYLGGFRNLIHGGDLAQRMIITFELKMDETALPAFTRDAWAFADRLDPAKLYARFGRAEVHAMLLVRWDAALARAYVEIVAISYEKKWLGILQATPGPAGPTWGIVVNEEHPLFLGGTLGPEAFGGLRNIASPDVLTTLSNFASLARALDLYQPYSPPENIENKDSYKGIGSFSIASAESLWPDLDQGISIGGQLRTSVGGKDSAEYSRALSITLSRLMLGPLRLLRNELRHLRHIGPIRHIPPRDLQPGAPDMQFSWRDGSAAWHVLSKRGVEFASEVSRWLKLLGIGYSIRIRQVLESEIGGDTGVRSDKSAVDLLVEWLDGEPRKTRKKLTQLRQFLQGGAVTFPPELSAALAHLRAIPTRLKVALVDEATGQEMAAKDVGIGVSQLIPVIIAAWDQQQGTITAVEQPELHVHPSVQVGLGDLFIRNCGAGRTFLLETHSEHLLLRLLRRIRETSTRTDIAKELALRPDQVSIVFLEKKDGSVKARPIRVDASGDLVDEWPGGFFEERAGELF